MPATPTPGGRVAGEGGRQVRGDPGSTWGAWTNGKTDRRGMGGETEGEQTQGLGGWKAPERGNLGPRQLGGGPLLLQPTGAGPKGKE